MLLNHPEHSNKSKHQTSSIFGLMLIVAGVLFIVDLQLKTKWLTISIPAVLGIVLLIYGFLSAEKGWLIAGALVTGIGLGTFFALQQFHSLPFINRFGYLAMFFAVSWLIVFVILRVFFNTASWWALICAAVFGGGAYSLLFSSHQVFDFVLSISIGLGIVFLFWGWIEKLLGLIIPGSLLITIGPGISVAWSKVTSPQGLVETGVMLVWFALGWLLITVFSRIIFKKFTWWPLIPGGVLAMVGWGLYIGGNPGNALDFVGNTGSIGLIIFGIYLLLLRFGMQK
ncbi:MAG: hypothetical protein AB9897_08115 [Anaerolineaceae bacterium]